MRAVETELSGVLILETRLSRDSRGWFARTWDSGLLRLHGLTGNLEQVSVARNASAGTLRGLHFQLGSHAEAKSVRCLSGAIFDVAVDLRPTHLRAISGLVSN